MFQMGKRSEQRDTWVHSKRKVKRDIMRMTLKKEAVSYKRQVMNR